MNTAFAYREFIRNFKCGLPDGFCGESDHFLYVIHEQNRAYGFLSLFQDEDRQIVMNVMFTDEAEHMQKVQALYLAADRAVKVYGCEKILCRSFSDNALKALNACMFYRKGKVYQRVIEPLRRTIPNSAFDPYGYLIHQGLTKDVPFGWFDSKRKGCGWIAAYNLLKINGREMTMQSVIEGLQKTSLLGEVMGQNEVTLMLWLKKQGLDVHRSIPSDALTLKKIKESRSGILLYMHRNGNHYAAYETLPDGRIRLYNAMYGKVMHDVKPADFLRERSLIPLSSVIYVK